MTILLAPLLAVFAAGNGQPSLAVPPAWQLVFCQPDIDPALKRGRASFSVIYRMVLDAGGTPRHVEKVKGQGADDLELEQCLRRWILPISDASAELEVEFRWTHGLGWEWVELRSAHFSQRIVMGGNPCKYP
jgi:hypothetical protein